MIRSTVQREADNLRELWHSLHACPELGGQEERTTERIAAFLEERGIPFYRFPGLTGGYALLDAGAERTLCFRADIDALPVAEKTGVPFASRREGVMHACGHDMHSAVGAGIAVALQDARERLRANVAILFQPAEECAPIGGAKPVLATGMLQSLHIDEIYGMHVWPSLPVGTIALRPGAQMAASDHFSIQVTGRKAHAAEPHLGVDAVFIASEIATALVHKLHRELAPSSLAVVSIGSVQSHGRYNVICDDVRLEGTLRTTDEHTRNYLHRRMPEVASRLAAAYRGNAETIITPGYAAVRNDAGLVTAFSAHAEKTLGRGKVLAPDAPSLIGEDFSAYAALAPALYFWAGCGCEHPLHSERFLPGAETLPHMVSLIATYLLERA